jgi:glycosyltransferase 2 family protein
MRTQQSQNLRWLRWGGTLVSGGLFIWLLLRQDWTSIIQSVLQLPPWVIPAAFILYFAGMTANVFRWYVLVQAQGVTAPFVELLKIVLAGAFASNFLPSTIGGDAIRIVGLLRYSVSKTLSAASVVVDRLLNVLAMFTILPFSWLTFGSPLTLLDSISGSFQPSPGGWLSGFLLTKFPKKLKTWIVHIASTLKLWISRPWVLLLAFIVAWFSVFVVFVAVWLIARELKMDVTLIQVMGVMALTYLLTLLPISVNGYGLREIAVTTLYVQLGATSEQAITLAVVTRFITMIETLPGAIWLPRILAATSSMERSQPKT